MGANSAAGSPGGGGTKAQAQRYSTKNELSSAVKKAGEFVASGGITGTIIRGITQGIKKSKQNVLDYEGQAAGVTPMRSPITMDRGGDGGNNGGAIGTSGQIVQAPTVTSPTTAEVSQSAAADAARDDLLLRKRRAKAVGRSTTIVTGPTGSPTNGSLTLGRPSLLGRA